MKLPLIRLVGLGLLAAGLTTAPALSNPPAANPIPSPATAWVASPSTSFLVRTHQTTGGWLMVAVATGPHVAPAAQSELSLTLWTAGGDEILRTTLDRRAGQAFHVDVNHLPDGIYRLEIASNDELVTKRLTLTSPAGSARQATVAVVATAARL